MRLRVDGETFVGSALDLRNQGVDATTVVEAVGAEQSPVDPVHEQVGHIRPDMVFSLRQALVAAARSRGETTPHDEQARTVETALADQPPVRSITRLRAARKTVAATNANVDALREQVARLSGRVEARRAAGIRVEEARQRLQTATRRLSEAETERIAAEQRIADARRAAREERDVRERRLKLADRQRNLRQRIERTLVSHEGPRFERAVASLPVDTTPAPPSEFSGAVTIAALAVVRLAQTRTPVVIEAGPFRHAAQARACLDAPVVLL